jgi:hypothetical protein
MTTALNRDIEKLKARAFDRAEWAGEALLRYHAAVAKLAASTGQPLQGIYQWMFVPTTLWPFNVQDVLEDCLTVLEKGKRLNSRHRLLIDLLPEPPDDAICVAVADHELHVQKGTYENLVKTQAKYSQNEIAIRNEPQLRQQWARIKTAFDVQKYRDHKGVIRRTMTAERNLRPSFSVNVRRREDVFHAAFDAFCLRWNLYGMQHEDRRQKGRSKRGNCRAYSSFPDGFLRIQAVIKYPGQEGLCSRWNMPPRPICSSKSRELPQPKR